MARTGFIGMGNMGYAMMKGALKKLGAPDLLFTELNKDRGVQVSKETGVTCAPDHFSIASECKYIVLAIKPQYYESVMNELCSHITSEKIVITIAPGIEINTIKEILGESTRVVRAMPNTPALVNKGMTGLCYSDDSFTDEEKDLIDELFSSFGKYEIVEEAMMDAVGCVSGSSPAFAYMFIEALADSGVKYGIPRDKAIRMAAQAVYGAAAMVLETKEHPSVLKDKVCSPGGTTIAGLSALEEYGLRNAVIKASDSCYEKSLSFRSKSLELPE